MSHFSLLCFLLCLPLNFILSCDLIQKWKHPYHNSYQSFFSSPPFPRLLMPGKIFQTFSDFYQNLPLHSREPLETHVCNFPHTSYPHASFLSYQLGLEMIFYSFHSSPSHSTLKPPPFFYLTLPLDILPTLTLISLFFLFLFSRQLSR